MISITSSDTKTYTIYVGQRAGYERRRSLDRQLSRRGDRHPPIGHGTNLRAPNYKFCQIGVRTRPLGQLHNAICKKKYTIYESYYTASLVLLIAVHFYLFFNAINHHNGSR